MHFAHRPKPGEERETEKFLNWELYHITESYELYYIILLNVLQNWTWSHYSHKVFCIFLSLQIYWLFKHLPSLLHLAVLHPWMVKPSPKKPASNVVRLLVWFEWLTKISCFITSAFYILNVIKESKRFYCATKSNIV